MKLPRAVLVEVAVVLKIVMRAVRIYTYIAAYIDVATNLHNNFTGEDNMRTIIIVVIVVVVILVVGVAVISGVVMFLMKQ